MRESVYKNMRTVINMPKDLKENMNIIEMGMVIKEQTASRVKNTICKMKNAKVHSTSTVNGNKNYPK